MSNAAPGLVLQHGPHAPPGLLADWLEDRGLPHTVHAAWRDPLPTDPSELPFIVSLGSELSTLAEDPAWVAAEVDLLRRAIRADVPVLGLCFGGQALALALGGSVGAAPAPEIGWIAVETAAPEVVGTGPWLEFHFEAFAVPPGARRIAHSAGGPQAFVHGPHLGTQFHPEVTAEIVDGWAELIGRPRLAELGVDRDRLREDGRTHAPAAAHQAERLFDAWWSRTGAGSR